MIPHWLFPPGAVQLATLGVRGTLDVQTVLEGQQQVFAAWLLAYRILRLRKPGVKHPTTDRKAALGWTLTVTSHLLDHLTKGGGTAALVYPKRGERILDQLPDADYWAPWGNARHSMPKATR